MPHLPKGFRPDQDSWSDGLTRQLPREFAPLRARHSWVMAHDLRDLAANGVKLYEAFRPEVPSDVRRWAEKGILEIARIRKLARGGER